MLMAIRKAFKNGFNCAKHGGTLADNPFKGFTPLEQAWIDGFNSFKA